MSGDAGLDIISGLHGCPEGKVREEGQGSLVPTPPGFEDEDEEEVKEYDEDGDEEEDEEEEEDGVMSLLQTILSF